MSGLEQSASPEELSVLQEHAVAARAGSHALNALSYAQRQHVLRHVAAALETHTEEILLANQKDMEAAVVNHVAPALLKRLELTTEKLHTLAEGIRAIAAMPDPLGKVLSATQLDDEMLLVKETASIGVLLIVFESRPDSLPQIVALALCSGNGLLLKGGREAEYSNATLHRVMMDAVVEASEGRVPRSAVGLITNRADVYALLRLDQYIDLVIPRGSNAMVQSIQRATSIPVLGHADGICHVYLHEDAMAVPRAAAVVVDAKVNYPAACNAAETLLLHRALLTQPCPSDPARTAAQHLVGELQKAGVELFGGPAACAAGLVATPADSMHVEYGDKRMTVEVVDSLDAAVSHINRYGSHHTDAILTASRPHAALFQAQVDSACVFHNCSTRFADGFRFGLGAEVGISTSRIHARGPVGVDGLLTQKWKLCAAHKGGETESTTAPAVESATVGEFASGERVFAHRDVTDTMQKKMKV